jgi:hypothetical protein
MLPAPGRLGRLRRRLWRPVAGGRRRPHAGGGGTFNLTRLLGALIMLAASGGLNWLTAPERFQLEPGNVSVTGLHITGEAEAQAALGNAPYSRPNLFRLPTAALVRELEDLPAVARVEAQATLPDALAIMVTERVPVLIWRAADQSLLVDAHGIVISAATAGAEDLPHATDRRADAQPPAIGERVDSIDLAAALRLAALTPQLIESEADGLALEIEDEHGWVLAAEPSGWQAAFGHYTPNLRPPTIIDQQVQCLRSLLADLGERELEMVFLSPSEDRCGTFRVRPTPTARIFQNVGWHARPARAG